MTLIKKNNDPCGNKTVFTAKGLQGDIGPPGGFKDFTVVHPKTKVGQNEIQGTDADKSTDIFFVQIDRLGFLEAVEVSIETPPPGAANFAFNLLDGAGVSQGTTSSVNISLNESRYFNNQVRFNWTALSVGAHKAILKLVSDPVTGIPDKLLDVFLNVV